MIFTIIFVASHIYKKKDEENNATNEEAISSRRNTSISELDINSLLYYYCHNINRNSVTSLLMLNSEIPPLYNTVCESNQETVEMVNICQNNELPPSYESTVRRSEVRSLA